MTDGEKVLLSYKKFLSIFVNDYSLFQILPITMPRFLSLLLILAISASSVFAIKTDELIWHSADSLPLYGSMAPTAKKAYSRLPDSLESRVRPELWALGLNSAGLAIRFRSDASALGFKWKSLNKFNMNHMTPTGIRGMDLYVLDNGKWDTVTSVRPSLNNHKTTTMAITDMTPEMREYMLYLPLYDGIDSIYIGVDSAAVLLSPAVDLPSRQKPIVMYGTSILQGGCATRAGMIHTSMLGRMFNREVINLGFSGNGQLDKEIAMLIAQSDPSVVVLDMLPNCTKEQIEERLVPFYEIIRKALPDVPILMVESPIFPIMKWNTETNATITEKNLTLARIFNELAASDKNLYYYEGSKVLNDREGTVDNYHLTDLGFKEFANNMYPVLLPLVNQTDNAHN